MSQTNVDGAASGSEGYSAAVGQGDSEGLAGLRDYMLQLRDSYMNYVLGPPCKDSQEPNKKVAVDSLDGIRAAQDTHSMHAHI